MLAPERPEFQVATPFSKKIRIQQRHGLLVADCLRHPPHHLHLAVDSYYTDFHPASIVSRLANIALPARYTEPNTMRGLGFALRAAAVYGVLAASSGAAVSPHTTRLHQRAPEVSPTTTPTPTTGAASSVTAISECHLHDTTL